MMRGTLLVVYEGQ